MLLARVVKSLLEEWFWPEICVNVAECRHQDGGFSSGNLTPRVYLAKQDVKKN